MLQRHIIYIGNTQVTSDNQNNIFNETGTDTVSNLEITGENSFSTSDNGMWFMVAKEPLTVTGTGTAFTVVNDHSSYGVDSGGTFVTGNDDGNGPTLIFNAWNIALDLQQCSTFLMNGGTIITEGKNKHLVTEGYLTDEKNYMQGGAFYSFNYIMHTDTDLAKSHRMQRIYPAPDEDELQPTLISEYSS